jgi:two-component system LytT family response regulator
MIRIGLIDDEPAARQALRTLLSKLCPDVEVVGEADGVASGVKLIRQTNPHAVLLDISMEDGSGFDLLDLFPSLPFKVIFTTASDEFALKAFRYNALDYLLKPVAPKELLAALDRIGGESLEINSLKVRNALEDTRRERLERIALTSQEGLVFLHLDQIIHLESDGNYTTFYMVGKERHVVARPMRAFEELLPPAAFFRIHQSHMVHRRFVKKVLKEDGGYALMEDGSKLPLARRRKEEFFEWVLRDGLR